MPTDAEVEAAARALGRIPIDSDTRTLEGERNILALARAALEAAEKVRAEAYGRGPAMNAIDELRADNEKQALTPASHRGAT